MKLSVLRYSCTIFLLSLPLLVHAQELWPGDVNNNGIVNGVDVLYIGLAFSATGPERSDENDDWNPVTIEQLWNLSFPDGINFAYADCNGDGVVDGDDISVIEENYGLTHGEQGEDGFANGLPGIDPPLSLTPSSEKAEPGNRVDIGLELGTTELPAHDFYGVAFQFSYDPALINNEDDDDEDEEIEFEEVDDSWITRFQDDDLEVFLMTDPTTGRGEVAITRTNQQSVPMGDGPIGLFTIVIEDIVVGLEQPRPLEFRIDRVRLIDTTLQTTAIAPDTTTIIIAPDTSLVTTSTEDDLTHVDHPVELFPNPSRGDILFSTPAQVEDVKLFHLTGQSVPIRWYPGVTHRIVPQGVRTGIYVLHILMKNQLQTKTVTIISQ